MLEQLAKAGKTPKALLAKPEVSAWLTPYISAFNALSNSRQIGMTTGCIPISEINAYCEMINEENKLEFARIIQAADQEFVESVQRRQKSNVKAAGSK